MPKRKLKFAVCGSICGGIYLVNLLYPLPDCLLGFSLGLAAGFLTLAFLPEKIQDKLRRWKCHGE